MRTRILLACLVVALVPLSIFVLGARREVRDRFEAQYRERVRATSNVIQQDLVRHASSLDGRLRTLARRVDDDAGVRAALLHGSNDAAVAAYAGAVMTAAGLHYLLLLDEGGTVLSSGHFRNDYGRTAAHLLALVAAAGPVLLAGRRPQGGFLTLARAHGFTLGAERFVLVGGTAVDAAFVRNLARDAAGTLTVTLVYPGGNLHSGAPDTAAAARARADRSDDVVADSVALPFVDDAEETVGPAEAHWTIAHSLDPLRRLQRRMDRWFLAATAAAMVLALLIARLLAAYVNKPLEELARKTTRVNLDRLDVQFGTTRSDEVGSLSRMLDAMVQRLRSSAQQLREAERRATIGDLARQVNHDIRNGLLPIRNVIRHLTDIARHSPDELGPVFAERERTLQGSIGYLESLATNYARLTPRAERELCDVNSIVRAVVEDAVSSERARIQLELSAATPRITADPVALRRVIENLIRNAIESLRSDSGSITVSSALTGDAPDRRVIISVADTGGGIAPEAMERIFDDFYSTKERGTGLGLSIVRRIVTDMGGRIRADSDPGRGSTFRIELPEAL